MSPLFLSVVSPTQTCRDDPCEANAECIEERDGYRCDCKPGYEKRGSTCVGKIYLKNIIDL